MQNNKNLNISFYLTNEEKRNWVCHNKKVNCFIKCLEKKYPKEFNN